MCAVRDKSYVRHISKPHLRWFTRIRRVDHRCMSSRSSREHQLDRSLCLTWKNLRPAENFQHLHLPTYNNVLLVIDGIKFIQGTEQMIFDYVHLYLGISYPQRPAELSFSCSIFHKIEKSPNPVLHLWSYIADYLVVD